MKPACGRWSANWAIWRARPIRDLAREKVASITIDDERLAKYAGVKSFHYGATDEVDQVGIVTGLAWTEFGGDILTIEAIKMPGKGRMTVTGNLKEVMKESDLCGQFLCQVAGAAVRHQAAGVREDRCPRPRAGRRYAQGWSVGRRRHGRGHGVGSDRHPDPQGHRHDRRDHPARPGPADRRPQGKAAGGPALRHQDRADPAGEREGPGRRAGQCEVGAGDHSGLTVEEALKHALTAADAGGMDRACDCRQRR